MNWTPEKKNLLKELHATSMTYQEIGERLGCTKGAIRHQVRVLGLEPRSDGRPRKLPYETRIIEHVDPFKGTGIRFD